MLQKVKMYKDNAVNFLQSYWYGLKVVWWLAIAVVLVISSAYFIFRKPSKKTLKRKR
jgi:hypothetical protein